MSNDKLENFGVYIWTSNQLMHCIPAWCYLFNKFWPYEQKVKVLGYNLPNFEMPSNFEYVSLGTQRGPKYWSDDMLEYFKDCEHDCFYLTTEDGFIVEPVNKDILSLAIKTALVNPNDRFLRFNLTCDVQSRAHQILKQYEGYSLIKSAQFTYYRQSLNHSIWRKESLVNKLIPGQSPWDFELDNQRAMFDNLDVYATKDKFAISCGHGYKKGKKLAKWYECTHPHITGKQGLSREDINYIEGKGWMPEI
tara:strand:- start:3408 stop:4157 length:750 start_codon:yes stop_codon:yes gene_type:complete